MSLWIKNTGGKNDAVLTMVLIGFLVVICKFLLAGLTVTVAGTIIAFSPLESGTIAAILTPTFGAYVARRYTDGRKDVEIIRMKNGFHESEE